MFSEKTKGLAEQLMDVYERLNESVKADTNGLAEIATPHRNQICFKMSSHENETLIRSYLPHIDYVTETDEFLHLKYKIGNVPFVTLVAKEEQAGDEK